MFHYVIGNLLDSEANALVNTVNCEGFMGKGIAYQFKLKFPENNADYIKQCKNRALEIGKPNYFIENNKIIINFPTKDKWREKSRIEYIDKGLDKIILLIEQIHIQSIAIPPLGCGNGGLVWADVKALIEKKLRIIANKIEVYIYEPSHSYFVQAQVEPKLSAAALILMEIKNCLDKFNKLRLQKAAYFTNVYSQTQYFKFDAYKFGPYDYAIDILSTNIREFQQFHNTQSTKEAREILYKKIISENVDNKLIKLMPSIAKACNFVNNVESDHELECLATVCYIIGKQVGITEGEIINSFSKWSPEKANRFSEDEILIAIQNLIEVGIICKTLAGYEFQK